MLMETSGTHAGTGTSDPETYGRISVYYAVLDSIIGEIQRRFFSETRPLTRASSALVCLDQPFLK